MDTSPLATYTSDLHRHRVACWAASRAASVPFQYPFKVKTGREWLHAGLGVAPAEDEVEQEFSKREFVLALDKGFGRVHSRDGFDEWHHGFVTDLKRHSARIVERPASYGVAAKLLNVYLKLYFLREISSSSVGEQFSYVHPPLDSILIRRFQTMEGEGNPEIAGLSSAWSTFTEGDYRNTIDVMRQFTERRGHIEVAAGFVAPGASESPRLQPSWPPGGSRPAHG